MLDREIVTEFLDAKLKDSSIKIPEGISKSVLVETFCLFTEDDLYEWLKDNYKSFFNHGHPEWDWIEDRIRYYQK